jgi:hypothetical protein
VVGPVALFGYRLTFVLYFYVGLIVPYCGLLVHLVLKCITVIVNISHFDFLKKNVINESKTY